MGYRTVTFSNEIEQRTHIQGEFTGKYYGTLNPTRSHSNFDFYDIHIYEGEINNLKNELEHAEVINETLYNALESESELAQKSFQDVLVNFDETVQGFDSFRLQIKEPKLSSVKISEVVKDGNQTFGTINCVVSGYLSKSIIEKNEIDVETCDNCRQFLEDCNCVYSESSEISIYEDPEPFVKTNESFWPKYFGTWFKDDRNQGRDVSDNPGFGCLGIIGFVIGFLFLISFGLPGILVCALVLMLYGLGSRFTNFFPSLPRRLNWILFLFLGLLLIGFLFRNQGDEGLLTFPNRNNRTESSIPQVQKKQEIDESYSAPKQNSQSQSEETYTLPPRILESVGIIADSTEELQNESQIEGPTGRPRLEKAPEIMYGTEFQSGDVYICNGKSSTRYHHNPDCPGLSNCSTRIYMINIPEAERRGRTLCKRED